MNSTAALPLEALRIIYDCDTIEDYLNVATPPVGQDVRHAFSVVQRPRTPDDKPQADHDGKESVVELVSARFDAQRKKHILVHVHPTKSETGWICDEIELDETRREDGSPVPVRPVSRIEAFYQSSKDKNGKIIHAIYALLHFQHEDDPDYYFVMAMQFIEGVGWQQWDLSDQTQRHVRNHLVKNRQTAVYRDNYGKHAFYGVSRAGVDERFFIIFQTTKGNWKAVAKSVKGEGRSTFRIVAPRDSWDQKNWTEGLLRIEGSEVFLAKLRFGRKLVIGDEEQVLSSEDDLSAANIIPLPTRSEARGFLLHSPGQGDLYYITNHQGDKPELRRLTRKPSGAGTLEQVAIGRTRTDQVIIFAVSQSDHRLWVLRQAGIGPDNTAQFGDWVCLGEQIRVLGCPRAMLDGPELFFVDMKRKLKHMSQAVTTTLWSAQTIAVPKPVDPSPERTVCHAVRITALDENDLPIRVTRLQLRASHPCVVLINDFAVHIDPLRTVEFYTDRFGTARLRLPADTLSAPTLYVSLDDGRPETAINPNERVMTRLKNKKIREKTLKAANLIPKDLDKQSSDKIAKLYRHIAELGDVPDETSVQGGSVRTHVFETSGMAMNATFDSVAGDIVTMADHETGAALWTAQKSPAIPILGDFLLQLRNGLVSVARFVVNFVKKTGQIVLEFTIGKLKVNLEFLAQKSVEAIEAVVNTLGELFRKIGKAIEDLAYKVLDWVAGVLGWEDIIRTNDAIKLFAFEMLDGLSEFFDQKAVAWNRSLVNKIGALLDMAEDEVRTMCEQFCVMSGGMLDPAGRTTSESMINDKLQADTVIVNTAFDALGFVFQWIEDRGNELIDMISPDDPDFKAFIDNFRNLLEGLKNNAMENIIEPAGKAYDSLLRSKKFNNPLMFIQAFPDIFGVLKGAIKFAVNTGGEIVEFVLKSIAIAVKLLKRLLGVKLNFIPFISEAYRRFHPDNEPLRLLDLFTLIMAIPATLLHKLIVGRAPVSEKLMIDIRDESDISWKGTIGAGIVVALSDKTMERHLVEVQSVGAMAVSPENAALDIENLQQLMIKPGQAQSDSSLKKAIEIVDAVDTVFGLGKIIFSKIETDLLQVKSVDSFEPEGTPGALAYLGAFVTRVGRCALDMPSIAVAILSIIDGSQEDTDPAALGDAPMSTAFVTVANIASVTFIIIDAVFRFVGALTFFLGSFIPVVAYAICRVFEYFEIAVNILLVIGFGTAGGIMLLAITWETSKECVDIKEVGKFGWDEVKRFFKNIGALLKRLWKDTDLKKEVQKRWEKVQQWLDKNVVKPVKKIFKKITDWAQKIGKKILHFFKSIFLAIKKFFAKHLALLKSGSSSGNILSVIGDALAVVGGVIVAVINALITFVIGNIVIILELIGWIISVGLLALKVLNKENAEENVLVET